MDAKTALLMMLADLREGTEQCLEYGDASTTPGGILSYLRIRYMNTAGGLQFSVKTLIMGREGSGAYFPDADRAADHALFMVHVYQRRMNDIEHTRRTHGRVSRERPALSWFFFREGQQLTPHPLVSEADVQRLFPGVVTHVLG